MLYTREMFHRKKTQEELDVDVRFLLANERTLLAWIRTGLTIIAGGIAISFVSADVAFGTAIGIGAIIFGGLLSLVGYSRYRIADTAIRNGELPSTGTGGILVVVGVVLFAAALVVVRSIQA